MGETASRKIETTLIHTLKVVQKPEEYEKVNKTARVGRETIKKASFESIQRLDTTGTTDRIFKGREKPDFIT